jgi:amidase
MAPSVPDDIAVAPATALVAALAAGEVSSRELLEAYLERVDRLDGAINAVVVRDDDRARRAADRADAARARGETLGPLHGLPMTVKESFSVAGLPTTCGAPELRGHVAAEHAEPVARLKRAGAVIFGKTNLPQWAADGQAFNELYGVTGNPWDLGRTPGGSSGGSAAALAAGLTAMELGSDIAGSVRHPAHMCGVFGLAPTFGTVPMRGHVLPRPGCLNPIDMFVAGPMGRGPGDLELGLDVLAGPDEHAARAWRLELPPARATALSDLRLAVWLDDPHAPVDASVLAVLEDAVAALEAAGARVARPEPPVALAESDAVFRTLLAGATGTGRLTDAEHAAQVVAGTALTKRDWDVAAEGREQLRRRWAAFFERFDALLTPVASTAAFEHQHTPFSERRIVVNGVERHGADHVVWTGLATVARLPAASVPAGRTADGLPAGLQVVGPHLEDRTVVAVARAVSDVLGGFVAPPLAFQKPS